jgi:hypothetical protein
MYVVLTIPYGTTLEENIHHRFEALCQEQHTYKDWAIESDRLMPLF